MNPDHGRYSVGPGLSGSKMFAMIGLDQRRNPLAWKELKGVDKLPSRAKDLNICYVS